MKFLKIPSKLAEKIRLELIDANLISNEYNIFNEGGFVFIPVKKQWKDFELMERKAKKRPTEHKNLHDLLINLLNEEELEQLTTSFDIVGDIAIIEIPDSLESKEKEIGEALLKVHKNLKSVFKKLSAMEGEYRIRKLGFVAGENNTKTVYREHGCRMKLDLSKVYFSVRLSHERERIANLVKDGEKIIVMFAGIGPFPLVISKKHPNTEIIAIEINPEAVKYMKQNIALNYAENIIVEEGDAKKIMGKYQNLADRIVMPLPKSAHEFLDVAFSAAKNGATIHFYSITTSFEEALDKVQKIASENNVTIKLLSKRIVRPYSHDMNQIVLDFQLIKSKNKS
ncbi:class I SAM-dependent methyltransferase family protein [Candidatus Micrarchaeota archaeon]|nr:class I SAM-dependent methyltransferase family protein [Candidatus Micrarchaeota archaeon]